MQYLIISSIRLSIQINIHPTITSSCLPTYLLACLVSPSTLQYYSSPSTKMIRQSISLQQHLFLSPLLLFVRTTVPRISLHIRDTPTMSCHIMSLLHHYIHSYIHSYTHILNLCYILLNPFLLCYAMQSLMLI